VTLKPRRTVTRSHAQPRGWNRLTHGAPLAVFLVVALLILYRLLPVIELVAVAALLALVFRTVLAWLQQFVQVRWIAILLLISIVLGFGLFVGLVIVPNLIEETAQLSTALPRYLSRLIALSESLQAQFPFAPGVAQGLQQLRNLVEPLVNSIPALLTRTIDLSIQTIAIVILAIYMASDPETLVRGLLRLAPRREHDRIRRVLLAMKQRLQGWIFGTGLAISIIGIGATLGLWILGVPLALSFGFLAGVLEVIPYIGSIVGALLPALVALTISPLKALFVLVLFLVLNQGDAHIVQPLIMAQRVRLHPVIVVLAFLCFGNLLGLLGVLLAVPAAAVLMTILEEILPPHEPPAPPALPES
jgi:predicted PurR-regulated permease PerM